MPGLSPEVQQQIREKAKSDATRMWHSLQPLASSPSTQFAERPAPQLPTLEQFVTPRPAPRPVSKESRGSDGHHLSAGGGGGGGELGSGRRGSHNWGDSIRAHSRKISDALSKPLGGYEKVGRSSREGSPYEMRALMDHSRTVVGSAAQVEAKMSGESFSLDDGSDGEVGVGGGRRVANKI